MERRENSKSGGSGCSGDNELISEGRKDGECLWRKNCQHWVGTIMIVKKLIKFFTEMLVARSKGRFFM